MNKEMAAGRPGHRPVPSNKETQLEHPLVSLINIDARPPPPPSTGTCNVLYVVGGILNERTSTLLSATDGRAQQTTVRVTITIRILRIRLNLAETTAQKSSGGFRLGPGSVKPFPSFQSAPPPTFVATYKLFHRES